MQIFQLTKQPHNNAQKTPKHPQSLKDLSRLYNFYKFTADVCAEGLPRAAVNVHPRSGAGAGAFPPPSRRCLPVRFGQSVEHPAQTHH